jgi:hypothetical protein
MVAAARAASPPHDDERAAQPSTRTRECGAVAGALVPGAISHHGGRRCRAAAALSESAGERAGEARGREAQGAGRVSLRRAPRGPRCARRAERGGARAQEFYFFTIDQNREQVLRFYRPQSVFIWNGIQ